MNRRTVAIVGIVLSGVVASPVMAQSLSSRPAEPEFSVPMVRGLGYGIVGMALGGIIAHRAGTGCREDDCGLRSAFYGAAIGGTVGMAVGVHLGNRRRGSFALDAATSAAVWGAGLLAGAAYEWNDERALYLLAVVPVVQMLATVTVERAVGRAWDRISLSVTPQRRGAIVALTVPLPMIH